MFIKIGNLLHNTAFIKKFYIGVRNDGGEEIYTLVMVDDKDKRYELQYFSSLERAKSWVRYVHTVLNIDISEDPDDFIVDDEAIDRSTRYDYEIE